MMPTNPKPTALCQGGTLSTAPDRAQTLPQALQQAAQQTTGLAQIHYVRQDGTLIVSSYATLLSDAERICAGLRAHGLQPQDHVILQVEDNQSLLSIFWGCLLGGFIPVIAAVPPTYREPSRALEQLLHIWKHLNTPLIVMPTAQAQTHDLAALRQHLPLTEKGSAFVEALQSHAPDSDHYPVQPDEVAFFSLTSGSTGAPKCIMLTHRNLLARARGTNLLNQHSSSDVALNWLPFDHIGSISDWHVRCVELGCKLIYAPREYVLARPLNWLNLIDQHRVTHSWAPNFAYALITNALKDEAAGNWDLSCVAGLLTAGEAVSPATVEEFIACLAPYGFPPTAIRPAFGMAEMGSGVSYFQPTPARPIQFHTVTRASLVGEVVATTPSDPESITFTSLGPPIPGVTLRIVDADQQVLPEWTVGRLQIQGEPISLGYYKNPAATAKVFLPDGWFDTEDLAFIAKGELVITGRAKDTLIINGANYYSNEIEEVVETVEEVAVSFTAACAVRPAGSTSEKLAIFFHTPLREAQQVQELLRRIQQKVVRQVGVRPDYLLPVEKAEIPKTAIGKLQRNLLRQRFEAGQYQALLDQLQAQSPAVTHTAPRNEIEEQVATIWREVLDLTEVGVQENFFELGGHSILLVQMHSRLQTHFARKLALVDLFRFPTIESFTAYLSQEQEGQNAADIGQQRAARRRMVTGGAESLPSGVAVIGMACRFPGANNITEFWQNLRDGVDSITFFSAEELLRAGVDPQLVNHPHYVKANPIIPDIDQFDAEFFGYSPREAEITDPQQRILLECAWETLETAGYNPLTYPGSIGMYAGANWNTYQINNLFANRQSCAADPDSQTMTINTLDGFQMMVGGDKDFVTTRVSYKLNLTGPSVNVQTACSTSLTAIHLASQSLLHGECDMMLAGGVSVQVPQTIGYLYQDGMMLSPDGHCRAFDAQAQGTIFGSGVGLVLLKRLEDALQDGDTIYAVIKGSALNNDGGQKVGFLAPRSDGQAIVVAEALSAAAVDPSTVTYVEMHGTATILGDPIEVEGVSQAFRGWTDKAGFCAIGSVKTNIGHMQIASGVAGFIKTALSLYHQQLPANLHFDNPNPQIDFANSPFYVNAQLQPWPTTANEARRAGVNSLGLGGANAFVVLEEAPPVVAAINPPERASHLLTLSARQPAALQQLAGRYQQFLQANPAADLANVAFTSNQGRNHFEHRLAIAASTPEQASAALDSYLAGEADGQLVSGSSKAGVHPKVAFLFTGQGSQYVGMGRELYETQPTFRAVIDRCDEVLKDCLGRSLIELLYPATTPDHNDLLESHPCGQASNFAIECALADLWRSWGIQPDFVLGHSLGDFAAAYTAGVFSLEDGMRLVTERGQLMTTAIGAMVWVMASESAVAPFLRPFDDVVVSVIGGPRSMVISGGEANVAAVANQLYDAGFTLRRLGIGVAAHSPMLDPVLDRFEAAVRRVSFSAPKLGVISSMTGQPVTEELTDPTYWRRQMRNTVRFADGVQTLHKQGVSIFLEIGPKPTLLGMVQTVDEEDTPDETVVNQKSKIVNPIMLPSLREGRSDWQQILESLGALYVQGAKIDWVSFDREYQRRKVVLPTYPFQRQRYWIDAAKPKPSARATLRPLLDKVTRLPLHNETVFETEFSVDALPFLSDHRVYEAVVSPGACQLALVLNAAELLLGQEQPLQLADIILPQALVLPVAGNGTGARTVQAVFTAAADSNTQQEFKLVSFAATSLQGAQSITPATHATGYVAPLTSDQKAAGAVGDLAALQQRCHRPVNLAAFYSRAAAAQIELGPSFRWLAAGWQGADRGAPEALAKVVIPESVSTLNGYAIHPGLLDACFQMVGVTRHDDETTQPTLLPFAAETLQLVGASSGQEWWCHARQTGDNKWDIQLLNPQGDLLLAVKNFEMRAAEPSAIQGAHLRTDWLRTLEWVRTPLVNDPAHAFSPTGWLVFGDEAALTTTVLERLTAQGTPTVLATPGTAYTFTPMVEGKSWQQATVDPQSPDTFHQLLATVAAQHQSVGVVYLWGMTDAPAHDATPTHTLALCSALLHLAQALAETTLATRLWLVTQGCQRIAGEPAPDAALIGEQAAAGALWGLGRTLAQEFPACGCTCIDLEDGDPALNAALLQQEMHTERDLSNEPLAGQIVYREGVRYAARLADWSASAVTERKAITLSAAASYLVTGGLGGLGLQVAQQLIADGAKHLVLSGRKGATTETAQASIDRWRAEGVDIQIVQADVAQLEDARQLLLRCDAQAPLRGIVHVAGLLDDGALAQQSAARFTQVMQPKVAGTWHLHSLTAHHNLDFFVCFSSMASLLGSAGQSNYAAANAFMDTLMEQRRALGLPGSSIQWGPWAEVGLAAHLRDRMQAQGIGMIAPHQGRALFQYLLGQPSLQVGVIPAKVSALGQIMQDRRQSELAASAAPVSQRLAATTLHKQLQTASGDERRRLLAAHLRAEIARALHLPATSIGDEDHLFQLGFDSLMAVGLKNRVQAALGCTLRSTLLFDHPTVAALTAHLDKLTGDNQTELTAAPLVKADRTQPLPLSFAQQRLWFNQTSNRTNSYNIITQFRLEGPLDLRALEQSLDALLERHEVLRTVFPTVNGAPVQVITEAPPFKLVPIKLQALDAAEQTAAIERLIQQEVQHIYELDQGPLLRVVLAKLAPERHFLLFSFNHILIDAGSLAQILDELGLLYQAFVTGAPSPLAPLTLQYADHAAWQRQTLTPALIESRVRYWVERLTREMRETPLFKLSHDKPRPERESFRGATLPFQIPVQQTQRLQALQKASGATLFNTVLAAWAALLHRYGQGEELVFGSPFANRTHSEMAGVIGHWASMLILPVRLAENPTFLSLMQQVSGATQTAMANDVPIDQLVQALPPTRKRNNLPHQFLIRYLQVNLTLDLQPAGISVIPLENKTSTLRPDLVLTVCEEKSADGVRLVGEWEYKVELFEERSIRRMIEDFYSLLEAVVADPAGRIDTLPLPNLSRSTMSQTN